jgi:two-component system, cell cycle response regulator
MSTLPKILVIDDEPIIRETLESLLDMEDLELHFAENGEIGLQKAREILPDAILLDVMMPGMDGYEVARQLRADPATAEIHIIMITALDDRNSRLMGLVAGVDDFLTKPFDGFEIQIRVKNIARISRFRTLVAERSRFYWVVENAEKGYLLLDEEKHIQYANQRAQEYFHLPEEYRGIHFDQHASRYYEVHHPENIPDARNILETTYLVQPETEHSPAFWLSVEVLNTALGIENQNLVRVSNITNKMTAYHDERKIRLMVAHKLRTPVALIYSSMDLLDRKMELIPPAEVQEMVHTAWKGAARLVDEVREILKYIDAPLSLSAGNATTPAETGRLAQAAAALLELNEIRLTLPEAVREQKLKISTPAMELIVFELLENAKKFHPQHNPQVEVQISPVDDGQIQIDFLDDGQTLTAAQIDLAQQPFLQAEKWFTGEADGLGLGIPLIASLVWQAGGRVRLHNRLDRVGICVSLSLPLA